MVSPAFDYYLLLLDYKPYEAEAELEFSLRNSLALSPVLCMLPAIPMGHVFLCKPFSAILDE
ncbi:hypothetical protein FCULG_00001571 [Fusarium culmorum]|uniref:Uncharacterized protein n=1 Tax=Fusarium culmorum TaxID=5516 RepID=A0A2T4GP06_FUSCU|nr:hypothetical protein FCULG_00001571 [Fusarium culmorum]